ncbi:MAG: hypothetical protein K0S76_1453 [Herbinix sp.]|jgi:ubiquinone/menaquinone biosynthesis C-methylase UbiE|nr:hypothetical protein [Herbinix sp.]
MDLHDYEDVAMNYDHYLSVMYSGNANPEDFKAFYLGLANEYGKEGIIDIACGTGAVLLHLAENGHDISGFDLSEAMANVAKKKAEKLGLKLQIYSADMTNFRFDRKFSLAIIARSGFMHLTTPELQRKALMCIREHLLPEGILTLNTFVPNVSLQFEQMNTTVDDYTLRLEYTNYQGKCERLYNAITYDPLTQLMSGNWKFETLDDNGTIIDTRIRPLKMRQTTKMEMEYLIELCGYEIINVYGDYNRTPASDKNLIWVLRLK